jgi:hypothetical protein
VTNTEYPLVVSGRPTKVNATKPRQGLKRSALSGGLRIDIGTVYLVTRTMGFEIVGRVTGASFSFPQRHGRRCGDRRAVGG